MSGFFFNLGVHIWISTSVPTFPTTMVSYLDPLEIHKMCVCEVYVVIDGLIKGVLSVESSLNLLCKVSTYINSLRYTRVKEPISHV